MLCHAATPYQTYSASALTPRHLSPRRVAIVFTANREYHNAQTISISSWETAVSLGVWGVLFFLSPLTSTSWYRTLRRTSRAMNMSSAWTSSLASRTPVRSSYFQGVGQVESKRLSADI